MSDRACTIAPVHIEAIDNLRSDQESLLRAADSLGDGDGAVDLPEFDRYRAAVRSLTADFLGTRSALIGALQVPLERVAGLSGQEQSVLLGADRAADGNGKVSVQELRRYMADMLTTADPRRMEDAIREAVEIGCTPEPEERSLLGKIADTIVEIFTLGSARTRTWG